MMPPFIQRVLTCEVQLGLFFLCAASLSSLYSTLDPYSISQHFAFYELYPEEAIGKRALKRAWTLLSQQQDSDFELTFPSFDLSPFIYFFNRTTQEELPH